MKHNFFLCEKKPHSHVMKKGFNGWYTWDVATQQQYVGRQVGNGLGDYLVGRCMWMVST